MIEIAREDTKKFTIPNSAEIVNVKHLASYNWVEKPSPTIVVPGSPSLWLPLNSPRRVAKDSGLVYINQNAARYPERPLEPLFRELFVSNPSFDVGSADIVTDRNNLRKLLKFVDDTATGEELDAFVIHVEHIQDTGLLSRVERNNSKRIKPNEFVGYGHEFEKAQTRELITGSTGHHRIVSYDLGELNLIVRHETDAYEDEQSAPMSLDTAVKASEDNLADALESLSLSTERDSDGHDRADLVVLDGGRFVPIEQILEIKTRVSRKPIELEDVASQLWFSQTPKLVRAYHQSGRFQKAEVEDVTEEIKAWEKSHQLLLRRLVGLIQEIRIVTKECGGKAIVSYDPTTEKLCISKKTELNMLPKDIRRKWASPRSSTSTSPASEKSCTARGFALSLSDQPLPGLPALTGSQHVVCIFSTNPSLSLACTAVYLSRTAPSYFQYRDLGHAVSFPTLVYGLCSCLVNMATAHAEPDRDGLKVIHVALFRMGTLSLAEAYRVLGYKVHHGSEDTLNMPWTQLEHAAEATWPGAPDAQSRPRRTRADWDELWGNQYDIATDMASPFADQLIEAYPEAKVVIVQRDFEPWWASYNSELLDTLFSPVQRVVVFLLSYVMGIRAGNAMRKIHFGFFGARKRKEIEPNARRSYDNYYQKIRSMVPPDKRLEYRLGDGWEPLCAFLGKDVPNVPFPRKNHRSAHNEEEMGRKWVVFLSSAKIVAPWVMTAGIAAALAWYVRAG